MPPGSIVDVFVVDFVAHFDVFWSPSLQLPSFDRASRSLAKIGFLFTGSLNVRKWGGT